MIRKAVIPVAGYGTRLLPLTKVLPKEMLPILGRPVIQILVEELAAAGIEEIVIVTSTRKHLIQEHFAPDPMLEQYLRNTGKDREAEEVRKIGADVRISFTYQHGPWGNGGAVLNAASIIGNEPFLVVWGDELFVSEVPRTTQLIEAFSGDPVVGLTPVAPIDAPRYGIPELGEGKAAGVWEIKRIIEKPAPTEILSGFACAGGYVVTPEIVELLRKLGSHAVGEIYLTHALDAYARKSLLCGKILEGTWHDIGTLPLYLRAVIHMAARDNLITLEEYP